MEYMLQCMHGILFNSIYICMYYDMLNVICYTNVLTEPAPALPNNTSP